MWNLIVPKHMHLYFTIAFVLSVVLASFNIPGMTESETVRVLWVLGAIGAAVAASMYSYLFKCHYKFLKLNGGNGHAKGLKFKIRLDNVQTIGIRLLTLIGMFVLILFVLVSEFVPKETSLWIIGRNGTRAMVFIILALEMSNVIRQIRLENWIGDNYDGKDC